MSVAKKCDVCSKLYEEYNAKNNADKVNGLMFLNIDYKGEYFSHKVIDCCPECMDKILKYIGSLACKTTK